MKYEITEEQEKELRRIQEKIRQGEDPESLLQQPSKPLSQNERDTYLELMAWFHTLKRK